MIHLSFYRSDAGCWADTALAIAARDESESAQGAAVLAPYWETGVLQLVELVLAAPALEGRVLLLLCGHSYKAQSLMLASDLKVEGGGRAGGCFSCVVQCWYGIGWCQGLITSTFSCFIAVFFQLSDVLLSAATPVLSAKRILAFGSYWNKPVNAALRLALHSQSCILSSPGAHPAVVSRR